MRKPRFEVEVFIPGATGVLGWHEVGESVPTTKKAARAAVETVALRGLPQVCTFRPVLAARVVQWDGAVVAVKIAPLAQRVAARAVNTDVRRALLA
jgi:hypothetical protein